MATHNQLFEGYTDFIATRGVREYRETIPIWVTAEDVVLEIGCEWGTTTTLIAPHCKKVIGTDISPKCIERARETHPKLHFEVLDGFDVRAALDLGEPFSKSLHRHLRLVRLQLAPRHNRAAHLLCHGVASRGNYC